MHFSKHFSIASEKQTAATYELVMTYRYQYIECIRKILNELIKCACLSKYLAGWLENNPTIPQSVRIVLIWSSICICICICDPFRH